jgi:hypothetical protein
MIPRRVKIGILDAIAQLNYFGFQTTRIRMIRIQNLIRFIHNKREFTDGGGHISKLVPILSDFHGSAGESSGHYFHQDLFVANQIFKVGPQTHRDFGSRIDGFVAHVASFRKIYVADVRPLKSDTHENIEFIRQDLLEVHEFEITDSLSCLHTLEHIGLGRYGDRIDPDGHIKALSNLLAMLKIEGRLYLSFPIGRHNSVDFNKERIFKANWITSYLGDSYIIERFEFVDDHGDLHLEQKLDSALSLNYGCGIYTILRKK